MYFLIHDKELPYYLRKLVYYFQKDLMSGMSSRSNRLFNFIVKKWPKTGNEMGISLEDLEDAKERHEVIDLDQD